MDENRVRQIIAEELSNIIGLDRFLFQKHLQIFDARNIQLGRTTGTKIGTGIDQKIGFYDTTPIIQRSGVAQDAIDTTGATQTTPWGYSSQAQANAIITLANELRAALVAIGIIKGSA